MLSQLLQALSEDALAKIRAEAEAKVRAEMEVKAEKEKQEAVKAALAAADAQKAAQIAKLEEQAAQAKKAQEEAEKAAAEAKAAAATKSPAGGAAWAANFKGDFELPVPKASLKRQGDQVYSVELVPSNETHAAIIARVHASLGEELKSQVKSMQVCPA